MLHYLASDFLVELRGPFDLYHGHEDEFVESILLLDQCDRLLDEDLLSAYQGIGIEEEAAPRFFASLIARLGELAADEHADPSQRSRAAQLELRWREAIADKEEGGEMLSVAEVAARFGVRPQAVYKWIHAAKIKYEERPGGSYRIPAAQFRTSRDDHVRQLELERRLLEKRGGQPPPTDEEIVDEMRTRRRG
jgi:excisionase family DNA binding protein